MFSFSGETFVPGREREDDRLRDGRRCLRRRRHVTAHRSRSHCPVRFELCQEVAGESPTIPIGTKTIL